MSATKLDVSSLLELLAQIPETKHITKYDKPINEKFAKHENGEEVLETMNPSNDPNLTINIDDITSISLDDPLNEQENQMGLNNTTLKLKSSASIDKISIEQTQKFYHLLTLEENKLNSQLKLKKKLPKQFSILNQLDSALEQQLLQLEFYIDEQSYHSAADYIAKMEQNIGSVTLKNISQDTSHLFHNHMKQLISKVQKILFKKETNRKVLLTILCYVLPVSDLYKMIEFYRKQDIRSSLSFLQDNSRKFVSLDEFKKSTPLLLQFMMEDIEYLLMMDAAEYIEVVLTRLYIEPIGKMISYSLTNRSLHDIIDYYEVTNNLKQHLISFYSLRETQNPIPHEQSFSPPITMSTDFKDHHKFVDAQSNAFKPFPFSSKKTPSSPNRLDESNLSDSDSDDDDLKTILQVKPRRNSLAARYRFSSPSSSPQIRPPASFRRFSLKTPPSPKHELIKTEPPLKSSSFDSWEMAFEKLLKLNTNLVDPYVEFKFCDVRITQRFEYPTPVGLNHKPVGPFSSAVRVSDLVFSESFHPDQMTKLDDGSIVFQSIIDVFEMIHHQLNIIRQTKPFLTLEYPLINAIISASTELIEQFYAAALTLASISMDDDTDEISVDILPILANSISFVRDHIIVLSTRVSKIEPVDRFVNQVYDCFVKFHVNAIRKYCCSDLQKMRWNDHYNSEHGESRCNYGIQFYSFYLRNHYHDLHLSMSPSNAQQVFAQLLLSSLHHICISLMAVRPTLLMVPQLVCDFSYLVLYMNSVRHLVPSLYHTHLDQQLLKCLVHISIFSSPLDDFLVFLNQLDSPPHFQNSRDFTEKYSKGPNTLSSFVPSELFLVSKFLPHDDHFHPIDNYLVLDEGSFNFHDKDALTSSSHYKIWHLSYPWSSILNGCYTVGLSKDKLRLLTQSRPELLSGGPELPDHLVSPTKKLKSFLSNS